MPEPQDIAMLGFEEALAALEARVRRLESGEVGLEEALALYEEGVNLARTCHERLQEAERRVAALSRSAEGIREEPLSEPEDE